MTYTPEKPLPDLERIVVAADLRKSPRIDATYALSLALSERGFKTEIHIKSIHRSLSGFDKTMGLMPFSENFNAVSLMLDDNMYCIDLNMRPCSWGDILFYYHQLYDKSKAIERPNILTRLNLAKNDTAVLISSLLSLSKGYTPRVNFLKDKILGFIDNPHKKYRPSKPPVYKTLDLKNLDHIPNNNFNFKTNNELSLALSKLLVFEINSRMHAIARALTFFDGSAPTATTLKKSYVKNNMVMTGFQHFMHHPNTDITLAAHDPKQWNALEIIQGPDIGNHFYGLDLSEQWQPHDEKIEKTWQKDDLFGSSTQLNGVELQLLAAYQNIVMETQTKPSRKIRRITSNRL